MSGIKSLEDLKRIREEALVKRRGKTKAGSAQVIVGMGTCGIAAGACDTMSAILSEIENENLSGITVSQTGCIGLCKREPVVHVVLGENAKVTYGKVTPQVARRILKEHVLEGHPVQEYVIEA